MKIAYFDEHGMLYDVSPRNKGTSLYENRDVAYQMDILVLNGVSFDLSNANQVHNIPYPIAISTWNILELSYVFKIRCGAVETSELIRVFVPKALNLMQTSSFIWRRKDYLQVIRNFYRLGLFSEGDSFEKVFREEHPDLFNKPEDVSHEVEHQNTKAYFKKKWEKKNLYIL